MCPGRCDASERSIREKARLLIVVTLLHSTVDITGTPLLYRLQDITDQIWKARLRSAI